MEINISIKPGLSVEPSMPWLRAVVEKTLAAENGPVGLEMGVLITGQAEIQALNRDYRGLDRPTDVLAFALSEQKSGEENAAFIGAPDGLKHLGEVIISYPQAALQAREHGYSLRAELSVLLVHGVLHLLGYDHEKPEMAPVMQEREKVILESLKGEIR
jgi:probable rRNA maturation factor